MSSAAVVPTAVTRPVRDVSIDYLRTTLTLMVLAHHSSLAYTTFAHFNPQDMWRSTAPVVDTSRWIFFDYAENFNDVFFMSLMFFVSGLFVFPSLRRHGTVGFLRDRFLRLGIPFVLAVVLLMPVAYYASWQLTGRSTGFLNFYRGLAIGGFPAGPPWFVWVLLLFDVVLALLLAPLGRWIPAVGQRMRALQHRPWRAFIALLCLSAVVYLPLLYRYGFGTWTNLVTSPFSFQISRIGLYALWFVFGYLVGAGGLSDGLLSHDGTLARGWPLWLAGCILAYNVLWFLPGWEGFGRVMGVHRAGADALLWVMSCVASCFGFLALFRGTGMRSHAWMNSLARSAYVMYLVHYVFVTWTQRLLLHRPIHAGVKFLCVFLSTTLLSWLTAQVLLRIPGLRKIL